MSFLVSLLLPVIAVMLYFRSYPDRAARGLAPARLSTASAIRSGALTGASALLFLAIAGVVTLALRGKLATPTDVKVSWPVFWAVQFGIAALIGAAVGAVSAVGLLPWVRGRLADAVPDDHPR